MKLCSQGCRRACICSNKRDWPHFIAIKLFWVWLLCIMIFSAVECHCYSAREDAEQKCYSGCAVEGHCYCWETRDTCVENCNRTVIARVSLTVILYAYWVSTVLCGIGMLVSAYLKISDRHHTTYLSLPAADSSNLIDTDDNEPDVELCPEMRTPAASDSTHFEPACNKKPCVN